MMENSTTIRIAAVLGALAVAIGAFGAHGLEPILTQFNRSATFETAVKYHFYHALAIFLVGILISFGKDNKWLRYSVGCWVAGIVIFSGSLYLLSVTNITWLGAVTPFGGLALIAGWVMLFVGVGKKQ